MWVLTLCEVSGGVPEFEPRVRYHTFADPGVRFTAVRAVM